jgi:cytochrome P450
MDEIFEVYADHEHFSAIVAALGPLVPLPKPETGESWAEVIERHRSEIPMGHMLTSIDPPRHTRHRALAGKLFTPNRLKQNEEFMWTLADGLIDEFPDRGEAEFCDASARPFTLLVIADLLAFRARTTRRSAPGCRATRRPWPETPKAREAAIRASSKTPTASMRSVRTPVVTSPSVTARFCPGASLARAETRISFARLLARLDDLQLVDPSALSYAPSFIIRGLNDLPLRFRRRS